MLSCSCSRVEATGFLEGAFCDSLVKDRSTETDTETETETETQTQTQRQIDTCRARRP